MYVFLFSNSFFTFKKSQHTHNFLDFYFLSQVQNEPRMKNHFLNHEFKHGILKICNFCAKNVEKQLFFVKNELKCIFLRVFCTNLVK